MLLAIRYSLTSWFMLLSFQNIAQLNIDTYKINDTIPISVFCTVSTFPSDCLVSHDKANSGIHIYLLEGLEHCSTTRPPRYRLTIHVGWQARTNKAQSKMPQVYTRQICYPNQYARYKELCRKTVTAR